MYYSKSLNYRARGITYDNIIPSLSLKVYCRVYCTLPPLSVEIKVQPKTDMRTIKVWHTHTHKRMVHILGCDVEQTWLVCGVDNYIRESPGDGKNSSNISPLSTRGMHIQSLPDSIRKGANFRLVFP